jgi:monoterpene epsilon-lactone hydrolase
METSGEPSWQSRALNVYLRTVKRKTHRFDIEQSRRFTRRVDRFFWNPRNVELTAENAKGVDGEWIVAPESRVDRVILYLHGGGFCLSETILHKRMVAKLCRLSGFKAYMPFYRLAPEHPFPAGLDDCVASYQWLLSLGIDPQSIVIAGDSAGGALTLSTLGRLRSEEIPLPACAVMISAGTDLTDDSRSQVDHLELDPLLAWDALELMRVAYLGEANPRDPMVSPVFLDYSGFPPLLFHVGSTELVYDHSTRAAASAQRANVDVRIKVWQGMPHVFQAMGFLPESRVALKEIAAFINSNRDSLPPG